MLGKSLLYLLALIQPHASVVDKHCMEAVADGCAHELCSNRGIDAPTDGTKNLILVAYQLPNPDDFLVSESCHCPVGSSTANAYCKVLEELGVI